MYIYKVHRQQEHALLAICDKELLGKTLHGDVAFPVDESFYGSERCSEKEALAYAQSATMVNAVGNKIVAALIKKGLAEKESTISIDGVMHCQIYAL